MTTLEQLSADPDALTTVGEMRDFHRTAGPESLLAFQYALHALAASIHWANQTWLDDRNSEWVEDRHEDCESCACPIRSVSQCANATCGRSIASVQISPPQYCSKRCRSQAKNRAAHQRMREFDERVLKVVRDHPDGIEVDLVAKHLQERARWRIEAAVKRLNGKKAPLIEERRDKMPGLGYAITWYLVPIYDSEGA